VGDCGFEIPVNDRDRSQIEGGMRTHQHPDPPGDREDRPEYETGDGRLLRTSQPLVEVVDRPKRYGRYEHGHDKAFKGLWSTHAMKGNESFSPKKTRLLISLQHADSK
jgi:hypothetical protein